MRRRGHVRAGRDCPRVRHIYIVHEEGDFRPTRLFAGRGGKEREMQVRPVTPRVLVVRLLIRVSSCAQRDTERIAIETRRGLEIAHSQRHKDQARSHRRRLVVDHFLRILAPQCGVSKVRRM